MVLCGVCCFGWGFPAAPRFWRLPRPFPLLELLAPRPCDLDLKDLLKAAKSMASWLTAWKAGVSAEVSRSAGVALLSAAAALLTAVVTADVMEAWWRP